MENREEIFDRPEAASAEGAAPVESQPRAARRWRVCGRRGRS